MVILYMFDPVVRSSCRVVPGVSVLVLPPPRDVWHPSAALGEVLRDAARNTGALGMAGYGWRVLT